MVYIYQLIYSKKATCWVIGKHVWISGRGRRFFLTRNHSDRL